MKDRRGLWALLACAAMAFGLRVYAIEWGLPDLHHPDEPYILNRALAFAKGDPSPHNFLYPTLYFYALFVWEGLFFVAGRLAGVFASVAAFEREFFVDPSRVVIAGRLLTALFGVATVAAVYRLGTRLYGKGAGLGAALLLAVAPFAVRDAHYIKLDVPVTLFVVLAQAAVARLVVDPAAAARRGPWMAAGAMVGLALSTQYYVFPLVLSIAAAATIEAHRLGRVAGAVRPLVWAGVASIAAFVAATPFLLPELDIAIRDMVAVRQINVDRAVGGAGAFTSLGAYLRMIATDAVGWPTAAAAAAGFALAAIRDWRRWVALTCFPLVFLAFLANTVPMSRYLNALLPSLAVAAAFAVTRGLAAVSRNRGEARPLVAAMAFVALAVPGLVGSLRSDTFYSQADTRTLARGFIERTAPPGATVLVQPHGVQPRPSREALVEALRAHLGSEARASIKFQKQLDAASAVSPTFRVLYVGTVTDTDAAVDKMYISPAEFDHGGGLEPLRMRRVAYAAVSRYRTGTLAFPSLDAALQGGARLLATFSPYRPEIGPDRRARIAPFFHNTADRIDPALERPGPVIEVWRIDPLR
ncbi:MAG: glycosyltransferase family 39 protein [Acidobacteriota bacterium]